LSPHFSSPRLPLALEIRAPTAPDSASPELAFNKGGNATETKTETVKETARRATSTR